MDAVTFCIKKMKWAPQAAANGREQVAAIGWRTELWEMRSKKHGLKAFMNVGQPDFQHLIITGISHSLIFFMKFCNVVA